LSSVTLEALSKEYKYRDTVPADLRKTNTFDWYLQQMYDEPNIARNPHQRMADMFRLLRGLHEPGRRPDVHVPLDEPL